MFSLSKNQLTNAVSIAVAYMPKDGEFTGKITVEGVQGNIFVKSSDWIQTVIVKNIPFQSSDLTKDYFEPFTIDGKKLLTALKAAKTDEIVFDIQNEHINIKAGRSKVKIETTAETQNIKIQKGETCLTMTDNLIDNFKKVLHAVDTGNPKPELNGILFQSNSGTSNIVGTDTRRLSIVSYNEASNDFNVIIPKEGVVSIIKLFDGLGVDAYISDTMLTIATDTIEYSTKLINGKFPDYNRILPKGYTQKITLNKQKFIELIKEASLFIPEIKILIDDGKITISDNDGNSETEDTVEDTDITIRFYINSKLVLDFLTSYEDETVQLCFNAKNLPIVFVANTNYQEVCMPIVVNDKGQEHEK